MKKILIGTILFFISQSVLAAGLINDMQTCQGLLKFLDNKLDSVPASYNKDDVEKVKKGLSAYDSYIQREIVSPGLLQFNAGDKIKAQQMQTQVDAYIQSLVKQYETRYPQNKLFADHAYSVNNCAKKAVPTGVELEALKQALPAMLQLAKS